MNRNLKEFAISNSQGIVGCATGALLVSGNLAVSLFMGACWAVGSFVVESFINLR